VTSISKAKVLRAGEKHAYLLFYSIGMNKPQIDSRLTKKMTRRNRQFFLQRILCSNAFFRIMESWAALQYPGAIGVAFSYLFSVLPVTDIAHRSVSFREPLLPAIEEKICPPITQMALLECPDSTLREATTSLVAAYIKKNPGKDQLLNIFACCEGCWRQPSRCHEYFQMVFDIFTFSERAKRYAVQTEFDAKLGNEV
jgi:hypothetical protein